MDYLNMRDLPDLPDACEVTPSGADYLVAVEGGQIVAFLGYGIHQGILTLSSAWTAPSHRRHGIQVDFVESILESCDIDGVEAGPAGAVSAGGAALISKAEAMLE